MGARYSRLCGDPVFCCTEAREPTPRNLSIVVVKPHASNPKVHALVRRRLLSVGCRIMDEGDIALNRTTLGDEGIDSPVSIVPEVSRSCTDFDDVPSTPSTSSALVLPLFCDGGGTATIGRSIHYFCVEWHPMDLSWAQFRAYVIGSTDPDRAPPNSVHGQISAEWLQLGLIVPPSEVSYNGGSVHASGSPFEALAERIRWLRLAGVSSDPFGRALLAAGVSESLILEWLHNPSVVLPRPPAPDDGEGPMPWEEGAEQEPRRGRVFDELLDLDAAECIRRCEELEDAACDDAYAAAAEALQALKLLGAGFVFRGRDAAAGGDD